MRTKLALIAAALIAPGLTYCKPAAESEKPAPDTASGGETACNAKIQARRAYASFKEPPGENSMGIAMLETEEILSSLRATACHPRLDLPAHAAMRDALETGALLVTEITFITPELDVAEVVASEASYGDAAAPDARSFSIRLRRARPAQVSSYTAEGEPAQVVIESWRITGLDPRPAPPAAPAP